MKIIRNGVEYELTWEEEYDVYRKVKREYLIEDIKGKAEEMKEFTDRYLKEMDIKGEEGEVIGDRELACSKLTNITTIDLRCRPHRRYDGPDGSFPSGSCKPKQQLPR